MTLTHFERKQLEYVILTLQAELREQNTPLVGERESYTLERIGACRSILQDIIFERTVTKD